MSPPSAAPATAAPRSAHAWLIDLLVLGALWGASFLFMRIAAPEFGALPTAAVRVAIATLFLLPLVLLRGQGRALVAHWKAALFVGIFNSGIPFALFAFALLTIPSGMAAVLNAATPMFGALIAWAWFGERPDGSRVAGLMLGFLGIALLAGYEAGLAADAHAGASLRDITHTLLAPFLGAGTRSNASLWAMLACLGACLCYGISASFTRSHLGGVPALATAAGSQIGATALLALPALWLWPAHMPSLGAWLALIALGIVCTGLAYILFFRIIASAGPARALTVTFLVPVFALVYGALLLGEPVTPWMLGCAAVVVCGVALSTGIVRLGRKQPRSRKE